MKKYLTFLLFCCSWRAFSQPAALDTRLSDLRAKDDLSGWIYAQIQWTARAPARRSGQLVSAVRSVWRGPRSPGEQQAWLDLLTNEGYSLLLGGSIVFSTDAYTAAYDYARAHPAIADAGLVLETVLKPLGNNYTRLGDDEQALYIHQKAAALAFALGDHEALAGVYSNLANTCGNMGRPMAARDYCFKGLAVARRGTAMEGLLFSELADAYREMGLSDSGKRAIRKSIEVLTIAHDHPSAGVWLVTAYAVAGDLYGGNDRALEFYERALELQRRLALEAGGLRQRDRAKLFWRLGTWYGVVGRRPDAIRWLDSCLAVLLPGKKVGELRPSDLYAENTLADALYALAGLSDDPDESIRLYGLSFAAGEKGRHELITAGSKERWVSGVRERFEKALDVAWGAWKRTGSMKYADAMLRFMESSKAQLLLDEVLQQQELRGVDSIAGRIRLLEKARVYYRTELIGGGDSAALSGLRETDWELANIRNLRKKTAGDQDEEFMIDSLGVLLPEGLLSRSYFAGKRVLYTIECGHGGIRSVDRMLLDSGWQDGVFSFIRYWFGEGPNHMIDEPLAYYREASGLYHRFFQGFDSSKEYILLPDGALSLLPVDALVAGDTGSGAGGGVGSGFGVPGGPGNWPFVIRRVAISYGYSLQTLWQQRRRGSAGKGFFGFFLAANRHDLPGLQATVAERSGIEPFIRNGKWFVDSLATKAAFEAALDGSAIVHISSHAFTAADSLDAPHIELYDAPFYLFENFKLSASLVVLSACRTGDGRFVSGEGVQSLARAFVAAGADAVVAGWWNVNDEVAAKLMGDFYGEMASDGRGGADPGGLGLAGGRGGVNAALALRRSKLRWIGDGSGEELLRLPYYWAALNYLGNPEPFGSVGTSGLKEGGARWWWWVLIGGVLVVGVWMFREPMRRRRR